MRNNKKFDVKNIKRFSVCLFMLLYSVFCARGQNIQVKVNKFQEKGGKGYYLKIRIEKNGVNYERDTRETFIGVFMDDLGEKLSVYDICLIVREILPYTNDYSISSQKVKHYYLVSYQQMYKGLPAPKSKTYPIAVDAMFAINRLLYTEVIYSLSTYPVLYDSRSFREVNDNSTMVKLMAKRYYQWLDLIEHSNYSKKDILSTEFAQFLNRGRVKWWDMILVSRGIQKEI